MMAYMKMPLRNVKPDLKENKTEKIQGRSRTVFNYLASLEFSFFNISTDFAS